MKNKVQLITYADRLGDGTIKSMTDILRTRFDGVYDGVHILPFFTPFDGADAGFDPIDHTKVDERLGSWDDVAELSKTHDIMVDAIVNHMSWESKQFQDVLAKGEESEYYPMFLTMSSVFPNGATEEDLAGIYRPRPGLPFTHYKFAGKTRLVWVSFTPQQVDIDTDSDEGWEYLMSIFDQMAASHVSYIRLDAVGYGAKEAGTSCFMTPKTFKLISRLREEGVKRGLEILIEVHSYYKKQVEIASKVDRVYDFALVAVHHKDSALSRCFQLVQDCLLDHRRSGAGELERVTLQAAAGCLLCQRRHRRQGILGRSGCVRRIRFVWLVRIVGIIRDHRRLF